MTQSKINTDQLREALSEDNTEISHIETNSGLGWDGIFTQSHGDAKLIFKAAQAHLRLLDGIEGLYDDCQTRCVEDMLQGLARNKALDDVMKLMEE